MELLMNIKWEKVPCYLCGNNNNFLPIEVNGERIVAGQFGYAVFPVICECGLVMLNPRWSKKDYNIFYQNFYDDLYRLDIKPDYGKEGVIQNMKVIWNRISHLLDTTTQLEILDAGAGSGAGFSYLREVCNRAKFSAIESSKESIKSLAQYGATVISDDLESDWSEQYKGEFDLIILRHVVEHFLDPVEALSHIKKALSPRGILYLATPDMMRPRIKLRDYDLWWEYWFRVVHTYYFSNETLLATAARAGLKHVIIENENEEIWCAMKSCENFEMDYSGLFDKQMKILKENLK